VSRRIDEIGRCDGVKALQSIFWFRFFD